MSPRHVWHRGLVAHLGKVSTLRLSFRRRRRLGANFCCYEPTVFDGGEVGRSPLHRCDQRQQDHALQHPHLGLGPRALQVRHLITLIKSPRTSWCGLQNSARFTLFLNIDDLFIEISQFFTFPGSCTTTASASMLIS